MYNNRNVSREKHVEEKDLISIKGLDGNSILRIDTSTK